MESNHFFFRCLQRTFYILPFSLARVCRHTHSFKSHSSTLLSAQLRMKARSRRRRAKVLGELPGSLSQDSEMSICKLHNGCWGPQRFRNQIIPLIITINPHTCFPHPHMPQQMFAIYKEEIRRKRSQQKHAGKNCGLPKVYVPGDEREHPDLR